MKDYKGYRMIKVTPKDIVIRDTNGQRVQGAYDVLGRNPMTYKEAKAVIDQITTETK